MADNVPSPDGPAIIVTDLGSTVFSAPHASAKASASDNESVGNTATHVGTLGSQQPSLSSSPLPSSPLQTGAPPSSAMHDKSASLISKTTFFSGKTYVNDPMKVIGGSSASHQTLVEPKTIVGKTAAFVAKAKNTFQVNSISDSNIQTLATLVPELPNSRSLPNASTLRR